MNLLPYACVYIHTMLYHDANIILLLHCCSCFMMMMIGLGNHNNTKAMGFQLYQFQFPAGSFAS